MLDMSVLYVHTTPINVLDMSNLYMFCLLQAVMGIERFKTKHDVFDDATNRVLFALMSKGVFSGLESPIAIGKEANVFIGKKDVERLTVKIYRVNVCDFAKMYSCIRTDPRFPNLTNNRRKVVFAWTKREFRNLLIAREAGVRVPTPFAFKDNVLVMELIGQPAQRLITQSPSNPRMFAKELIKEVERLAKTDLIHGELSPFNILNYNEKPVLIDFSQATTSRDPNAREYLHRDVVNLTTYFNKQGVKMPDDWEKKLTKMLFKNN